MISFAGGLPSPASFPKDVFRDLYSGVITHEGDDVLQYGASDGDRVLKNALKKYEGVPDLSDDEIMITIGSTSGIYHFTRTLIDPGDIIICEAPGFPGSFSAMESCGARLVGIEMDEFGMKPDSLKASIEKLFHTGERVKFIYTTPDFQNPTGRTMNLDRRRAVIETALTYEVPILEDQPYRELRFHGEDICTLWELARTEFNESKLVTIAKSFSKILGPGLRLGFVSGPPEITKPMVKWAQKSVVSPEGVTQRVAARFIEQGHMQEQIQRVIDLYRPRRDAMVKALEVYMSGHAQWTDPEGGIFVWVTLDESVDTDALFTRAVENKVAFIPGSKFYPQGSMKNNALRFNFSYCNEKQIIEGVRRLASLI
ncbi:MAG: PLP-dependent aminotransferase family protein [Deltaproteobacteria bacterium]|nr:PLP-dependent aminotransferase family protein [Deltaproteobacteria bacterium]